MKRIIIIIKRKGQIWNFQIALIGTALAQPFALRNPIPGRKLKPVSGI